MRSVVIPFLVYCLVMLGVFILIHNMTIVYIALLFPVMYLFFLLRDISLLVGRLDSALTVPPDGRSRQTVNKTARTSTLVTKEPFTKLFKNLFARFRVLEYRVNALSWEAESSSKTMKIPTEDLINETATLALDRGTDETSFYRKILKYALETFRCQCGAIAIVKVESGNNSTTKIITDGVDGKRFEELLSKFLSPYTNGRSNECFGLLDGHEGRRVGGDFTPFGCRYTLCYPFAPSRGNSNVLGILWLGYSGVYPPSEREVNWVKELASKIEVDLQSYKKLYELSGRIKEAEHLDKEKTEFMLHVSHDIRSPLNNIQSILNLLKVEGFQKDTPDMIDIALKNCDNVGEMVESILDYSKHRAGKLVARREILDLREIVGDIMEGFGVTARMKGLTLHVHSAFEKCPILADKRQIKRILTNIIGNAIKYTRRGEISVTIDSIRCEKWVISVKDTGFGMTKDQLEKLFTPFTRFHGDGIEGIGLGLALSQILTKLNDGEISVQSKVGEGSKFELTFPIPITGDVSLGILETVGTLDVGKIPKSRVDPIYSSQAPKHKVLVVDDDMDFVDTLARGLELENFVVMRSITVADAISLYNFDLPDVVITDGSMPDGGGKKLLSFIQNSNRPVPVLVLTGHDIEKSEFLHLGASKVLSKPADIVEIAEWIRQFTQNKESTDLSRKTMVA